MAIDIRKVSLHIFQLTVLVGTLFLMVALKMEPAAAETTDITFHDQLISAQLVDAPLLDVLQQIQQKFGFKAHFHGDLSERVTMSFSDMPLEKSLRLLTVNQSLSIATRPVRNKSEKDAAKQITEIWVLSRSKNRSPAGIAPAEPYVAPEGDAATPDNGTPDNGNGDGEPADELANPQTDNNPELPPVDEQTGEEKN